MANPPPPMDPAPAARLAAGAACLAVALDLVARGMAPTCCCDPEHISVGRTHGQQCTSPGKSPMHPWKAWQTRLPTEAEARAWWQRHPIGNVGLVLGQISGVVRVDVDGAPAPRCSRTGVLATSLTPGASGVARGPAVASSMPGPKTSPAKRPRKANRASITSCGCKGMAHRRSSHPRGTPAAPSTPGTRDTARQTSRSLPRPPGSWRA